MSELFAALLLDVIEDTFWNDNQVLLHSMEKYYAAMEYVNALEAENKALRAYRDGYDPKVRMPEEGNNVITIDSGGMGLSQIRRGLWYDSLLQNRQIRGIIRWWPLPEVNA